MTASELVQICQKFHNINSATVERLQRVTICEKKTASSGYKKILEDHKNPNNISDTNYGINNVYYISHNSMRSIENSVIDGISKEEKGSDLINSQHRNSDTISAIRCNHLETVSQQHKLSSGDYNDTKDYETIYKSGIRTENDSAQNIYMNTDKRVDRLTIAKKEWTNLASSTQPSKLFLKSSGIAYNVKDLKAPVVSLCDSKIGGNAFDKAPINEVGKMKINDNFTLEKYLYNVDTYNNHKNLTIDTALSEEYEGDEIESLECTVIGKGFFRMQALRTKNQNFDDSSISTTKNFGGVPVDEVLLHNESLSSEHTFLDQSIVSSKLDLSPSNCRKINRHDESLLVTPTLARYQLEPDDSSIGVRVIPRRASPTLNHSRLHDKSRAADRAREGEEDPGNVSRILMKENILPRIEEVLSPNVSTRVSKKTKTFEQLFDEQKSYINEMKTQLIDTAYSKLNAHKSDTTETDKAYYVIDRSDNNLNHEPVSSSISEKKFWDQKEKIEPYNQNYVSRLRKVRRDEIPAITVEEYNSAPPIVQMQVSFEEVNAAVTALNLWIYSRKKSMSYENPRLEDGVLSNVLRTTRRKCQGLMMSLCHWRRLNMRMEDNNSNFYFLLNDDNRISTVSNIEPTTSFI